MGGGVGKKQTCFALAPMAAALAHPAHKEVASLLQEQLWPEGKPLRTRTKEGLNLREWCGKERRQQPSDMARPKRGEGTVSVSWS